MGISYHIKGVRTADNRYRHYLELLNTLKKEGISIPKELKDFFNGDLDPDPGGFEVNIKVGDWQTDDDFGGSYLEVDLNSIPEGVNKLKFYISC